MNGIIANPHSLLKETLKQMEKGPKENATSSAIEAIQKHAEALGQKSRFKLFTAAVAKDVYTSAEKFADFGISRRKYKYKSAKQVAKASGFAWTYRFENFLPMKAEKIRKVVSYALENKNLLSVTLESFQKFKLNSHQSYALILKAANLNGPLVAQYFPNFGLNSIEEEGIFEIAKAAFLDDPRGSSKYIRHFGLETEKYKHELLLIRLKDDADKGLALTQKFGIQTRELRLDAATVCALYDGWVFSSQIQEWNFGEEDRLVLAMTSLQSHLVGALRYHANYKLGRENLFKFFSQAIDLIASKKEEMELIEFVKQSINDREGKYKLALRYAVLDPESFLRELPKWEFSDEDSSFLRRISLEAGKKA